MSLPNFLQYIPAAASFLLVVVGIFIAIEIYHMVSVRRAEKTEEKKEAPPETIQPLQFPRVSGVKTKKTNNPSISFSSIKKSFIVIPVVIISVLAFLGGVGYYVLSSGISLGSFYGQVTKLPFIPESAKPRNITPTPTRTYNTRILIYKETSSDDWVPLKESDISTLTAGDAIRIVVAVDEDANRIDILVNDDSIPLSPNKSPEGYHYARYIIPESQSQYNVAARIY